MFNTARTIQYFKAEVAAFHGSTLALVAAASVAFIAASAKDESPADTAEALHASVAETGLGRSSVFRYISSARKLVAKLYDETEDPAPAGSLIHLVLDARSPGTAAALIMKHLEKVKVSSVDRLDVYLGGTPRSERQQAAKSDNTTTPKGAAGQSNMPDQGIISPKRALDQMQELADSTTDLALARDFRDIWNARVDSLTSQERGARRAAMTKRKAGKHDGEHAIHG